MSDHLSGLTMYKVRNIFCMHLIRDWKRPWKMVKVQSGDVTNPY